MWAVRPSPFSMRAIINPAQALPDEVVVESIQDGLGLLNSVWDPTLNGGTGGLRPMTQPELDAAQASQVAQFTTANQTITALMGLLNVMTASTPTPPYTQLSPQQQATCLVALIRASLFLIKGSISQ